MADGDEGSAQQTAEERCHALTGSGERCGRTATDGRFCYQHDADDPTIDEEDSAATSDADGEGQSDESTDESGEQSAEREGDSVTQSESEQSGAAAQNGESADDDGDDSDDETGQSSANVDSVMAVRSAVVEVSSDLIGRPLDGVVEVGKTEDGWRAVVEVVERRAVPDTQDILGRYELTLDDADTVTGYRRVGRSRRADTGSTE